VGRVQLFKWAQNPGAGPFKALADKDGSNWDRLEPDPGLRKDRRAVLYQTCAGAQPLLFEIVTQPEDVGRWEQVDGKVRFYLTVRLVLPVEMGGPPAMRLDGFAVVEPVQAVNVEQFGTSPHDNLTWNLVRVVFTSEGPLAEKRNPALKGKGKQPPPP
jgi:hypothetical protein